MRQDQKSTKNVKKRNDHCRDRCQFHQHYKSSFCAHIFAPKNYKPKMCEQKSYARNFRTKKTCVKCWWNWPMWEKFALRRSIKKKNVTQFQLWRKVKTFLLIFPYSKITCSEFLWTITNQLFLISGTFSFVLSGKLKKSDRNSCQFEKVKELTLCTRW
jgi:hypothetical protein